MNKSPDSIPSLSAKLIVCPCAFLQPLAFSKTDRQTDKQTDTHTHKQTGRQIFACFFKHLIYLYFCLWLYKVIKLGYHTPRSACLPSCLSSCLSAQLPVCPAASLPSCLSTQLPLCTAACLPSCPFLKHSH